MTITLKEYSPCLLGGEAVILEDGVPLTLEDILARLNLLQEVRSRLYETPELNMSNFNYEDVEALNSGVIEVWMTLEEVFG